MQLQNQFTLASLPCLSPTKKKEAASFTIKRKRDAAVNKVSKKMRRLSFPSSHCARPIELVLEAFATARALCRQAAIEIGLDLLSDDSDVVLTPQQVRDLIVAAGHPPRQFMLSRLQRIMAESPAFQATDAGFCLHKEKPVVRSTAVDTFDAPITPSPSADTVSPKRLLLEPSQFLRESFSSGSIELEDVVMHSYLPSMNDSGLSIGNLSDDMMDVDELLAGFLPVERTTIFGDVGGLLEASNADIFGADWMITN